MIDCKTPPKYAILIILLFLRPEFSVFVGDLTSEVDDYQLHQFFLKKYPSCKGAKVVTDPYGNSKYEHISCPFLTASHLFFFLLLFQLICSEEKLVARTVVIYEPVVFYIYLAFPKGGHTIHGCDLPLLRLLKLSFFPYRISKSSSQMKWCYFMLKVKEMFYRQINLFLPFFENFEICVYCCMVQCVETLNRENWHFSVVLNDAGATALWSSVMKTSRRKPWRSFRMLQVWGAKPSESVSQSTKGKCVYKKKTKRVTCQLLA